jgi:hypothetical protein
MMPAFVAISREYCAPAHRTRGDLQHYFLEAKTFSFQTIARKPALANANIP